MPGAVPATQSLHITIRSAYKYVNLVNYTLPKTGHEGGSCRFSNRNIRLSSDFPGIFCFFFAPEFVRLRNVHDALLVAIVAEAAVEAEAEDCRLC